MSLPEILLWQRLKRSPEGVSFRKQHPIGLYRADFYCAAGKLVIEVDGIAHDMEDRPERDVRRTEALESKGCRVIRILATDILRNPDGVADGLIALAASPPPPSLRDGPPPRERGGS